MSAYMVWRAIKFLALGCISAGVVLAVQQGERRGRFVGLQLTTWGLLGAWLAGFAMMKVTGRTLREAWILWSMAASGLSLSAVAALAFHRQPPRYLALGALGGLVISIVVMVPRSSEVAWLVGLSACGLVLSVPGVWALGASEFSSRDDDLERGWRWFRMLARLEGLSLLALMGIYMPLKYGADILIDGGTGLLGWAHGVLFVVYLQALVTTGRALGWSIPRMLLGALASLLPLGTFLFEHRIKDAVGTLQS